MEENTPDKKIKILTISDHPLSPSGVGTQTKYFIVEMLKTGKFQFISFGGAIKHQDYKPQRIEEFGEDWIIFPVDGYGNQDTVRSVLRTHKPDIVWFMTDPRFFPWLWEMENEIRALAPMVYYHVWDNYPYPTFNKVWYESSDVVATISKVTSDIVQTVAPSVEEHYVPHAVPTDIFKPSEPGERARFRSSHFDLGEKDFLVFWNNRNARRKQSGSLLYWYADFLKNFKKKHKEAKCTLLLHTDPKDPNGQDLVAIINELGLKDKEALISTQKVDPGALAQIYSAADCTVNISDAEGFGLATFESLSCGTPVIVTMTGGLQEQVTYAERITHDIMLKRNSKNKPVTEYEHGIGLEPMSKAIIGSQEVPFIYEDRLSGKQVTTALMKMYDFGNEKRKELGEAGREHVIKNYSFEKFAGQWQEILTNTYEQRGSWDTRKGYNRWELRKV